MPITRLLRADLRMSEALVRQSRAVSTLLVACTAAALHATHPPEAGIAMAAAAGDSAFAILSALFMR